MGAGTVGRKDSRSRSGRARLRRGLVIGGVAALIFAAVIIQAAPAAAAIPGTGTFSDDNGSVHEANIEALAAAAITQGCNPPENTLYCPNDFVTRAQMATFLVRALGLTPWPDDGNFTDHLASVHRQNINAIRIAGITAGCNPPENTLYCPNDFVTRAQMATFLVRALGLTPSDDNGDFTDHLASVHRQNINAIRIAGITAGCNPPENTLYCPNDFVTRAQMATFLVRALGITPGLRIYRVNSGGPELGGVPSWIADDPASGYVKASNTAVNTTTETIDISDPSIAPGVPEPLFRRERWGFGSKMEWDFPVTPGRYIVQLYFAEIFFTTAGQRVMDVSIEDELVLDNFDTVAAAGGPMRAVMRSFTVTSDANLDIDLAGVVDNPAVKGIEIIAAPQASVLGSSPGMLDFGSIATGSNISHNLVLVNSGVAGDDPITLQGVSLTGTDASQFSFNFTTTTLSPGQTATIPVTFSPNVAGVKSAALQVQHTGSNTPLSVPLAGTGADLTRVNAGGAQVDATPPWIPDDPFVQPGTLGEFPTSDPIDLSHLSVPAGTPEKVFQTQRIGFDPNLTYQFDAAPGAYEVRLYFSEIFFDAPATRLFDIFVEGVEKINDYDIHADVGHDAGVMKAYFVINGDNKIDIDFQRETDNPVVSAIEIVNLSQSNGSDLVAAPTAVDFGPIPVGDTAAPVTVALTNSGDPLIDPTINIQAMSLTGDPDGEFTLLDPTAPRLGHGRTVTADVQFSPINTGAASAKLHIQYTDGLTPGVKVLDVPLNGSGSGPDLAVTKTVDVGTPNVGDNVTFTVTVSNGGDGFGATGVEITDLLPAGLSYVSDTPSQGTYDSGTGVWTVDKLAFGGSATLTLTASVDAGTGGTTIVNTASVSALTESDPDPSNDVDTAPVTVQQADLELTKTVDNPSPDVGGTVTFTVTLLNAGPNTASNITVADSLPAGLSYVSDVPSHGSYNSSTGVWAVGDLGPSASATLTLTATVDSTGTKTNTAQVSSADQEDPDSTPNNGVETEDDQDSASVTPKAADLSLTKIVDDPSPGEGATITYTITASNAGPNSATSVEVTDALPSGVTYVSATPSKGSYDSGTGVWTVGTITNGESPTLALTATVDTGTGGSTITNTAEVTVSPVGDPDSTPGNGVGSEDDQDTAAITVTVPTADLSLTKSVDDATPDEGQSIIYTITVLNSGPYATTGVTVGDLLPTGVTYVSDTPSQGSYVSGTGVWTVGDLANLGSATLTIAATVDSGTAGTTITNTAEVTASGVADPDSTPGNGVGSEDDQDTADVIVNVPTADLSLSKVASDPGPREGDTITYTITLLNIGPDTATGVEVTDSLPTGVAFVSALPSQGSYVSGTGVWTVGSMASPSSATLVLTVTVDSGTGGTTITNTAEVTASDQADPDSTPGNGVGSEDDQDTANITVESADLSLTKIVSNGSPNEGDTITYTVTVSNAGPDTATGVTVTDALPTGVTYVSDLPSQGSYVSGTGVWTVGSIAGGSSATLVLTATIDSGTGGTTITNTAEVTASDVADPDSTPGNGVGSEDDQDSAAITVLSADLSLTKVVDNAAPAEGATITYTITVSNAGPDTATNVTVTDLLPSGVSYVSDLPSQGSYVSGTGVWTVGSIAGGGSATLAITVTVDTGTSGNTITNTAEVTASDVADPDSTPGNGVGSEDDQDSASITVA